MKVMAKYSMALDYERAALVRDQIRGIEQLNEQQKVGLPDSTVSRDIIAIAANKKLIVAKALLEKVIRQELIKKI